MITGEYHWFRIEGLFDQSVTFSVRFWNCLPFESADFTESTVSASALHT